MSYGMLLDSVRCIGCEACIDACRERNNHPYSDGTELAAERYTVLKTKETEDNEFYYRQMCMHCEEPSCASVCPVGAFTKTKEGPVIYEKDKCMGCRYCMVACPFDVPKYQWNSNSPYVQKCDMCYSRIKEGKLPACAEACEDESTIFGERDELIRIARQRIEEDPDSYHPYIYGVKEAGGTSILVLAGMPLEQLGLPKYNYSKPFPQLTWEVLKEIPNVVGFGGVFLYGLWWIINRRDTLQKIDPKTGEPFISNGHEEGAES